MKKHPASNRSTVPLINALLEKIANERVRTRLLDYLFHMERPRFQRLMLTVLRNSGYANVRLAELMDSRGRTRQGGLDLKAYTETDIAQSLTIVMVKQYDYPVPRRFVSELLSAAIRVGASHAILITTSTFGEVARKEAISNPQVRVTLIDDNALMDLMITQELGVEHEVITRLAIDDHFFENLS